MFRWIFEAVSNKYFTSKQKLGMNVILRSTVLVLAVLKVRRKWTCPNFKERDESMVPESVVIKQHWQDEGSLGTRAIHRPAEFESKHGRDPGDRFRHPRHEKHSAFTSPLLVSSLVYMLAHSRLTFEFQWATLFCGSLLHFRNERTGRRACPHGHERPLVASVSLWILDGTKTVGNTPEFHGNGYLSFDREIGQVGQFLSWNDGVNRAKRASTAAAALLFLFPPSPSPSPEPKTRWIFSDSAHLEFTERSPPLLISRAFQVNSYQY